MAYQDPEHQAMVEEVEKRTSRADAVSPIAQQPTVIKIILIVILVGLFYFSDIIQMERTTKLLISAVIVIAFFMLTTDNTHTRLLSEQEVVAIANKQLVYKQMHSLWADTRQIRKDARIFVSPFGVLHRKEWGGEPYYWERGFTVKAHDGTEEWEGSIRNDPYTGMCYGIVERREGFTGREEPEKEFILGKNIRNELAIRGLDYQMRQPPPPNSNI